MIKIRLQSSTNKGYLYQFCRNRYDLGKILREGIKPSDYTEYTWEKSSKIPKDAEGGHSFVSFTRNPSAIIESVHKKWRYAVIIDSSKLTDNHTLRPYAFHFRPGTRTVKVYESKGEWWGKKTGGGIGRVVRLTADEVGEIIDWTEELGRQHKVDVSMNDDPAGIEFYITVNLGDKETTVRSESLLPDDEYADQAIKDVHMSLGRLYPISPDDVIHPIAKILAAAVSESEERLYLKTLPSQRDKNFRLKIKDAIVGVLIPDTEWFYWDREYFPKTYPGLKCYIYDDYRFRRKFRNSDDPELKNFAPLDDDIVTEGLRKHPEDKKLYMLPR